VKVVRQCGVVRVALGASSGELGTIDYKPRITCIESAFGSSVVVACVEVQHFTVGGERLAAMRKTFWDQMALVVIFVEQNGMMLLQGR